MSLLHRLRASAPLLALALLFCASLEASQIVDTLTDASGTPLNGTIYISWNSFTTATGFQVAAGNITAAVSNGVLNVNLAPNSGGTLTQAGASSLCYTASFYSSSSSVATWSENWQVPASNFPLTVAQVITTSTTCTSGSSGSGIGAGINGSIANGTLGQVAVYSANGNSLAGHTLTTSDLPTTGSGAKVVTAANAGAQGNCAAWNTLGNLIDAGAPCGTGSGSGSGTAVTISSAAVNGSGILTLSLSNGATVTATGSLLGPTGPAGTTGPTGAAGAAGAAGANGNTIWNGTGAPGTVANSQNGDFYIDTAAWKIYGPKASGTWPSSGTSIVGPTGATGATGPQGPAGPQGPTGASGTGSGTVNPGTPGQFGYYSASGAVIGGHTLVAGDIPSLPYDASGAATAAQSAALAASLQKSANLSDLASASTARTNLGLGSAATANVTAFDISGAAAAAQAAAIAASDPVGSAAARAAANNCATSGQYATGTGTVNTPCAQVQYSQIANTPTLGTVSSAALVTTLGSPGSNTNVASEAAIRTALTSAISGLQSSPAVLQASTIVTEGDSITAGYEANGVSGGTGTSYAALVSTDAKTTLVNHAVGGYFACDEAELEAIPGDLTTLDANNLYTLMIGTNDANNHTTSDGYSTTFNLCHQAAMAWIAAPNKFAANGTNCTDTGTWLAWTPTDATPQLTGEYTTQSGATKSCPITTTGGPIYAWYWMQSPNSGAGTYSVDGGTATAFTTAPTVAISAKSSSNKYGWGLIRIPVSAGAHTILFTNTTSGSGIVLAAVGTTSPAPMYEQPHLFVAGVIKQDGDANSAVTAYYDSLVKANVSLLAGDGLNITYVPVRNYICTVVTGGHCYSNYATPVQDINSFGSDILHPNAQGHLELKRAFEDAMQFTPYSSGTGMIYPPAGIPWSSGSGWGGSYTAGTGATNLVQLDSSGRLPAVSGVNLTALPSTAVVTTNASGNGSKYASVATVGTSGNCAKWDANGNVADAGSACGSGTGVSGTVNSGTTGQFAYYSSGGTAVGGHTLVASDIPALSYDAAGAATTAQAASLQKSNNLSDLASASAALTNLGISFTGTGTKTASATAAGVPGNCAKWDASGNIADAGAACGTSSGSTTFATIAGGTSTNALVIGSGGSLTTTGTGTIAATSVPASGVTGLATSATTDTTNASNIASGTLNAARLPATAVVTGSASGNGSKYASVVTAGASGNCAKWDANGNVADAGSACGSGSGTVTDSQLPSDQCVIYTATVSSSTVAALTSSGSGPYTATQTLSLSGLTLAPANQRICFVEIRPTTAFTGTSITAATVRLQSNNAVAYSPNQDIYGTSGAFGSTSNNYWSDSGSTMDRASSSIQLVYTFTGAANTAVSAGAMTVDVGIKTVP